MSEISTEHYYAHGKILLSGEYFVLDGAKGLALPTKLGQGMTVEYQEGEGHLVWESQLPNEDTWLEAVFQLPELKVLNNNEKELTTKLKQLLKAIAAEDEELMEVSDLYYIATRLEFERSWGLGSSSTLVSLLAQWSATDPYMLLEKSFGGSGYDIACATAKGPIMYQLTKDGRSVNKASVGLESKDRLLFVHLGKKQNSRDGIAYYRSLGEGVKQYIPQLDEQTYKLANSSHMRDFMKAMTEHERLVGEALNMTPVQQELFSDFNGAVKSLGAWGGDMVLAAADQDIETTKQYFSDKGYTTQFTWDQLILDQV